MSAHVIRCRKTGRPLASLYGGGTCVCPAGECRMQHEWDAEDAKKNKPKPPADVREAAE